jgi:hypothetical protein
MEVDGVWATAKTKGALVWEPGTEGSEEGLVLKWA